MLAPNAQLRKSVIQSAGPAGATLLLVRIYECLPLLCPRCNRPMRILAFIQDPPVIEKILHHIDESTQPPKVLPARAPPQGEMEFSPKASADPWPEMDQKQGIDDAGCQGEFRAPVGSVARG